MIVFPSSIDEVLAASGMIRAGGTDAQERRRLFRIRTGLVDLRDTSGLDELRFSDRGELQIGAMCRLADVAGHPEVRAKYPGFAEAAGGLATPQVRAVATIGGSVLQRTRCWYFRAPETGDRCFKRGGNQCSARRGDHLLHACFDLGPCVSVHPSTVGMALLAYDAVVDIRPDGVRSIAALFGDGSDPRRDHQLEEDALLANVVLPPPRAGEHSAYSRAISRARAEWPLVEVLARLVIKDATIVDAAISMGGVAPVPLRATAAETVLVGQVAEPGVLAEAARAATEGAAPLPMTSYKVALLEGTVLDTLERALAREPVTLPNPAHKLPRMEPTP